MQLLCADALPGPHPYIDVQLYHDWKQTGVLAVRQVSKPMHDSAVDIVQLSSNGKLDANGGEASQSALPFSQLYMTFNHGALNITAMT